MPATLWIFCLVALALATNTRAQEPINGEVRQIVTFSFLPGKSAEAMAIFQNEAIPLYTEDLAMLSFRGFSEVESPIPLSLMVVSSFEGMAGMDRSNARLRTLAEERGTSIGAIYGRISEFTSSHTDQFVQMIPALGTGDPSSKRLTAFVWYKTAPGRMNDFERALATTAVSFERASDVMSATGRFLVSDGWHYLRLLGFDSLGHYQEYWQGLRQHTDAARLAELVVDQREVIVRSVPSFAVR